MKYLLDTCVLLWALENNQDKLRDFMDILQDTNNFIGVSVASYWEVTIKKSLGKLKAPNDLVTVVEDTGFSWVNLETRHIDQLAKLPMLHSDPFDRLLIAQAKADGLQILTLDQQIIKYNAI